MIVIKQPFNCCLLTSVRNTFNMSTKIEWKANDENVSVIEFEIGAIC